MKHAINFIGYTLKVKDFLFFFYIEHLSFPSLFKENETFNIQFKVKSFVVNLIREIFTFTLDSQLY
jgi:hypothetical protein